MKQTLIIIFALMVSLAGCRQDTSTENKEDSSAEAEPQVELVTPEEPQSGEIILDREDLKITASTPAAPGSGGGDNVMEVRKLHSAGVQNLKQKKFREAIQVFDQVLELDPDNHHALYNRGFAYFNLKMYNEAGEDFNQAIHYNPGDSTARLYKGLIKYYEQDFEGAITEYSEALEVAPYYADVYYNRGIARGQMGNYTEARDDFSTAIRISPNHSKAYFNRGLAGYFMGDTVSACRDWNEAHALGSSKAMEAINAYCK